MIATPSFNLLTECWIPCIMDEGGRAEEFGLREVLARAREIREIADPSPLVTVTLHRLLLAILHRNFGPRNASEWEQLWESGRWDQRRLDEYFAAWHDRFDLFHHRYPFYQVASIEPQYAVTITKLTHELASPGNATTLFDHTIPDSVAFSPARAARYLLAYQSFAVGGLVSLRKGEDPKICKSADAAPLTKGAVTLVRGTNLFRTLMLNFHQYNRESEAPFPFDLDDTPVWERDEGTRPEDRHPKGYLDLLTWQSRRIQLFPETSPTREIAVRRVAIMKGYQFPVVDERHGRETMLAFRKNEQAKGNQDPWPAIDFREARAVWRDSLALFQSAAGQRDRPKMLSWLNELVDEGILDRSLILPLDLYGLSTDRANVLFWRHEQLPVPLAYLNDENLLDRLRQALALVGVKQVAGVLQQSVNNLARLLLAPESNHPKARQPDGDAVGELARSFGAERVYWARLDMHFRQFLVNLEADRRRDEDSAWVYGETEFPTWVRQVRTVAREAFAEATGSLDTSARSLKAAAVAGREFNRRLSAVLNGYLEKEEAA